MASRSTRAPVFPLRREAAGFYRSEDGRFSAQKQKKRRLWFAFDKEQPLRKASCRTLRQCRLWFVAAQTVTAQCLELTVRESPRLKRFF